MDAKDVTLLVLTLGVWINGLASIWDIGKTREALTGPTAPAVSFAVIVLTALLLWVMWLVFA